ncbi:hypothetical protein FJZ55_01285, partial [Candidatus Woesearchaeota archaeon]|nr:hypothetical protein [Candidatus Woesearchaeota archaeon]
ARDSETSTTADAEAGTGEKKDEEDNNSLTAAICAKNGAPGDMQRIIFGGRQLEPQETLSGVGIKDGSTIHLVLRLSGC